MRPHPVWTALFVAALVARPALAQSSGAPDKTKGDLPLDDLPLDEGPQKTRQKPAAKPKEPAKPAAGKTRLVPKSGKGAPASAPEPEGSAVFVATPPVDDLPLPPLPELPAAPLPEKAASHPAAQPPSPLRVVTPEPEAMPPPPLLLGPPAATPAPANAQAKTAAPVAPGPTAAPERSGAAPIAAVTANEPAAQPMRWNKVAGYGAAGAGALLVAIAGAEGIRSHSLLSDSEARLKTNGGAYAQGDLSNLQSGNAAAHTANLLFLLGGVAVAAGAALLFAF